MGKKRSSRRQKNRFHPGARRGHFTGKTRGKPVQRGSKEERGKRRVKRREETRQRDEEAFRLKKKADKSRRKAARKELPPLPPIE